MEHATAQIAAPESGMVAQVVEGLGSAKLELPLLPTTAVRVFEAAQRADTDAQQLARLVQSEQKLAVEVMRIANSAAYCARNPIVTLQQAVTRLGLSTVAEIAFAASFRSSVYNSGAYSDLMDGFWRRSLTAALWAKEVGRLTRKNVETHYLCGLFHNVCHPLALKLLDDHGQACCMPLEADAMSTAVLELAGHLTPLVQEQWQLPAPVVSVLQHTGPDYEQAVEYGDEVAGTWAACQLAAHTIEPDVVSAEQIQQAEVFATLNIYPDELSELLAMSDSIAANVEAF